uniref:Uncharacterized protein n=1 Tax=Panagrellus redivivus TaxID=6233 RepID=A0A7E4VFC6_PANRE
MLSSKIAGLGFGVLFLVVFAQARELRFRYPKYLSYTAPSNTNEAQTSMDTVYNTRNRPPMTVIRPEYQFRQGPVRRRQKASRFQNVFSNSATIYGTEFTPRHSLAPYTGRLHGGRNELFRWAPPQNILESTLINYP